MVVLCLETWNRPLSSLTTQYYLDGTDIIAQTDGANTLFFRYDSNDEIIGLTYSSADYFYVKNQVGDITGIVDINGNLVAEYEYDPWGAIISLTGSNIALANANPFRYRSYYYDSDTGMYYLQSRYYDPDVCRFINCDHVSFWELKNNSFEYCENNPVLFSDRNGHLSMPAAMYSIYEILCAILALCFGLGYTNYISSVTNLLQKRGYYSDFQNRIKLYTLRINQTILRLFERFRVAVNNTVVRAKRDIRRLLTTNNHHIIARNARGTARAKTIWTVNCQHSIDDNRNLVRVNIVLHWYLHTNEYYNAVDNLIVDAYNKGKKAGVEATLALLKQTLQLASNFFS